MILKTKNSQVKLKKMDPSATRVTSLKSFQRVPDLMASLWFLLLVACTSVVIGDQAVLQSQNLMPNFVKPVSNVTVAVGREATITCSVQNLGNFKVAWVRVDTQTILTIHTHVITRSHRIGLSHSDLWTWNLHVRSVKESDRGFYMCQINTDPMMSQLGFLQVVVPPDILDYPTSTDMVVRENANVTLQCAAVGFPQPTIIWRREDKQKISYGEQLAVEYVEGPVFNLSKVNRLHMGAYLCIASNGVPPTISRRITLIVHFPPMISIPNQLVGASVGSEVILECNAEAYPKSINYWAKDNGEILASGKHETTFVDNTYKVTMKLRIKDVTAEDFGTYVCVSKNSLGSTDGHIKLYALQVSTLAVKTTAAPLPSTIDFENKGHGNLSAGKSGIKSSSGKSRGNFSHATYKKQPPENSVIKPRRLGEGMSSDGPRDSSGANQASSMAQWLLRMAAATSMLLLVLPAVV